MKCCESHYPIVTVPGFVIGSAAMIVGGLSIIYNLGFLTGRLSGLNSISMKAAASVLSAGSFVSIISIALVCSQKSKPRKKVEVEISKKTEVITKIDWQINLSEKIGHIWVLAPDSEFRGFVQEYGGPFLVDQYDEKKLESSINNKDRDMLELNDSHASPFERDIVLVFNPDGTVSRWDLGTWRARGSSAPRPSGN